jgi:dienelactone hydrolase
MITFLPWIICVAVAWSFSPSGGRQHGTTQTAKADRPSGSVKVDRRDYGPTALPKRSNATGGPHLVAQQAAVDPVKPVDLGDTAQIDDREYPRAAGLERSVETSRDPSVARPAAVNIAKPKQPYSSARLAGRDDHPNTKLAQPGEISQESTPQPQAAVYPVKQEYLFFPAQIDGRTFQLEAMLYRPDDADRHPLVVFSHGRNGMYPARDPNMVYGYATLCGALAADGNVVAYIVRRGYGNSDGPDSELQDTAVLSGLEAAKDYKGSVEYWRTKNFVLPDRVVLMGQSQGGWAVLACTNVAMEGVLGVVNISGGTNYRLMGTGAVTTAVQDHWVVSCSELGARALVPSFWVYSENDQSISGPTARRMFDAFAAAGGAATMLMLPPYGSNGHNIVGQPDLFLEPVNEFFATIGLGDEPYGPPVIGPVAGEYVASLGGTAVITLHVTGFPAPALHWRKDGFILVDGGDISGATSATLRISHLGLADAGNYAMVATNSLGTAVSSGILVQFLVTAPSILTQPQNQAVTAGYSATFTVAVTGNPAPTCQWQWISSGSNNWTNLTEGGSYAGVTSAMLMVSLPTTRMSGDLFRCVVANSAGSVASNGATLTVTSLPAVPHEMSSGSGGGAVSLWMVAALALIASARSASRKRT